MPPGYRGNRYPLRVAERDYTSPRNRVVSYVAGDELIERGLPVSATADAVAICAGRAQLAYAGASR